MFSQLIQAKDSSLLILIFLIFITVFFLTRGIFLFLGDPARGHQRQIKKRLMNIDGRDSPPSASTLIKQANFKDSLINRYLEKLQILSRLQILMLQAGVTWRLGTLLGVASLLGLAGLGVGLIKGGILVALAAGGLGLLIPYRLLLRKKKRRILKFEKQLPEALNLLARGLRAGHTFPAGLQQISQEIPDPLGTEFGKTFQEFSHGMELNNALVALSQRIDLRDLSFFTTAVLIQRETGGNLTEILEKISDLIRERFKLRNQIKALTAEGRLSGLILILMPPVLGGALMLINPAYESQLFHHPTGQVMCGVALGFQFLGMMVIRKIVNIKV